METTRRKLISTLLAGGVAVALADEESWKPQFLTSEQAAALGAICDRIIPGSAAAHCDRVIDLVLTIESAHVQQQLLKSITGFDSAAQARFSKRFVRLPAEDQDGIVAELSKQGGDDSPFAVLKEWTADTYWSSREGLQYLGWKGQVAWSHPQVCDKPTH